MNEFEGKKTLRRSNTNRVLAGVCGGIGEYINVDPNIIRLAFAAIALFGVGSGVLLYVIAWLVMPEQGADASVAEHVIRTFQGKQSDM